MQLICIECSGVMPQAIKYFIRPSYRKNLKARGLRVAKIDRRQECIYLEAQDEITFEKFNEMLELNLDKVT